MHWSVQGAITFWGPSGHEGFDNLLKELEEGAARRVIFTMPAGFGWPLPTYELALMTSAHLADLGVHDVDLVIVTPEDAPLHLFGMRASDQGGRAVGRSRDRSRDRQVSDALRGRQVARRAWRCDFGRSSGQHA